MNEVRDSLESSLFVNGGDCILVQTWYQHQRGWCSVSWRVSPHLCVLLYRHYFRLKSSPRKGKVIINYGKTLHTTSLFLRLNCTRNYVLAIRTILPNHANNNTPPERGVFAFDLALLCLTVVIVIPGDCNRFASLPIFFLFHSSSTFHPPCICA